MEARRERFDGGRYIEVRLKVAQMIPIHPHFNETWDLHDKSARDEKFFVFIKKWEKEKSFIAFGLKRKNWNKMNRVCVCVWVQMNIIIAFVCVLTYHMKKYFFRF